MDDRREIQDWGGLEFESSFQSLHTTPDFSGVVKGLILQRKDGFQGEFERVGTFNCYCKGLWAKAWKEFGSETARTNCMEILDDLQHPGEIYVITIV